MFARFIRMWFNVSTSLKSPARVSPTIHMGNHLWEVNNIFFVSTTSWLSLTFTIN